MNIDSLDRMIIKAWHTGWHPEILDQIAPWWRDRDTWIIFYLGLIVWMVWRGGKRGVLLALSAGACVGLADFIAAGIIKPLAGRIRPCNQPGLAEHLELLTGCGSGLSFPSAHAANHVALAVFLSTTCWQNRPILKVIIWLWALSIAVAQVYVGRHYFSDIIAGALLGTGVGLLVSYLYRTFVGLPKNLT